MELMCRAEIRLVGSIHMTCLYHPMEEENIRFFTASSFPPPDLPSLDRGWKSHPSLPSDASKGDLQRRRVGLQVSRPVWLETIELACLTHNIMPKLFQRMIPRKHEGIELFISFILFIIVMKWLRFVCSWCLQFWLLTILESLESGVSTRGLRNETSRRQLISWATGWTANMRHNGCLRLTYYLKQY